MKDINLKEIIDLVVSEVPEAENKIEQIFDWYFDRQKTVSQWLLGGAASLIVSLLVSFSTDRLSSEIWRLVIILLGIVVTGGYGLRLIIQLKSISSHNSRAGFISCDANALRGKE